MNNWVIGPADCIFCQQPSCSHQTSNNATREIHNGCVHCGAHFDIRCFNCERPVCDRCSVLEPSTHRKWGTYGRCVKQLYCGPNNVNPGPVKHANAMNIEVCECCQKAYNEINK